jgi:hypothetical protein
MQRTLWTHNFTLRSTRSWDWLINLSPLWSSCSSAFRRWKTPNIEAHLWNQQLNLPDRVFERHLISVRRQANDPLFKRMREINEEYARDLRPNGYQTTSTRSNALETLVNSKQKAWHPNMCWLLQLRVFSTPTTHTLEENTLYSIPREDYTSHKVRESKDTTTQIPESNK